MAAWLAAEGAVVLSGGLVVPDGAAAYDPAAFGALTDVVADHPVATAFGPRPRIVEELSAFMSTTFRHHVYWGRATFIVADALRHLALVAAHQAPAKGRRWSGGVTFGLDGWGRVVERSRQDRGSSWHEWVPRPHHPVVRVAPLGNFSNRISFAKAANFRGQRAGQWERLATGAWRPYRGRWVDVIPDAGALDGLDSDDLAEHLVAFEFPALSLPASVPVTPEGAARLAELVEVLHRFALGLDDKAAGWL